MGCLDILYPVPQGLVNSALQRGAPFFDGDDGGAQKPHPLNIDALSLHVSHSHVDNTLKIE